MASPDSTPALSTPTNGILTNGNSHDGPVEPAIAFDPNVFRAFLLALLPPLLSAATEELQSLFDEEFDGRVSRFATEGGGVIYVVKKKDDVEGTSRRPLPECRD